MIVQFLHTVILALLSLLYSVHAHLLLPYFISCCLSCSSHCSFVLSNCSSWQWLSAAKRFVCFPLLLKMGFWLNSIKGNVMFSCIYTWTNEVMLSGYNCNFLLQTLWQWWLLSSASEVWAFYSLVKQYLLFLATVCICVGFGNPGAIWAHRFFCSKMMNILCIWSPKISSFLLTMSHLRTQLYCSHLCFHFAFTSWHSLHALHIYLNIELLAFTIRVSHVSSEKFCYCHGVFVDLGH